MGLTFRTTKVVRSAPAVIITYCLNPGIFKQKWWGYFKQMEVISFKYKKQKKNKINGQLKYAFDNYQIQEIIIEQKQLYFSKVECSEAVEFINLKIDKA